MGPPREPGAAGHFGNFDHFGAWLGLLKTAGGRTQGSREVIAKTGHVMLGTLAKDLGRFPERNCLFTKVSRKLGVITIL